MTEAEFYLELAKLPALGWRAELQISATRVAYITLMPPPLRPVDDEGDECDFCPITAVCRAVRGQFFMPNASAAAAKILGLDEEFANRVIRAADGYSKHGSDPATRSHLLRALDLVEAPREVA